MPSTAVTLTANFTATPACSYSLNPTSVATLGPVSATGSFTVVTQSGCAIAAPVVSATSGWLTASLSGSTVNFSATQNTDSASRTGTITVGSLVMTITQGGAGLAGSCGLGYPLGNWRTFGTASLVGSTLTVGDNMSYDPSDSDGDCNPEAYIFSASGAVDSEWAVYSQSYTQPISFAWTGCIGSTAQSYMGVGLAFVNPLFTGAPGSNQFPAGQWDVVFMTRWENPGQLFVYSTETGTYVGTQVAAATSSAGGMCGTFEVRSGGGTASAYFNGTLVQQVPSVSTLARVPYVRSYDRPVTVTNAVVGTVASPMNGVCGAANGGVFATAPTTDLCAIGAASSVSSVAPWTWTCAGTGGGSASSCSAQLSDTTPDAFVFAAQSGVSLNTTLTSNTVTITGINASTPISVSGGTYSIGCTGTFTGVAGTISNNQSVCVRHTSSAANSTAVTTTLTVGSVSSAFTSTTVAATPVNGICGSSNGGIFAAAPTVNLCAAGSATPVTGAGPWSWSCNGANGGTNQSCSAQLRDESPDFTIVFTPQIGVALNSVVTSNTQTVTGINVPSPIAIVGGTYSIGCNGTFTSSNGFINNNEPVCVRHTSAVTPATDVRTQLCIGGFCADFVSTTQSASTAGVCAVQPAPGKDTFFGDTYQTQGQPTWEVMFTGGWGDSYSSLVEIDVSALPSAATTQSATLWLYVVAKGANDPALQLFRITSPWTAAGVTLANVPTTTLFGPAPPGVLQGSWYKIDITSMYKDWKNGLYPNYGVMLSPTFTTNSAHHFSTSESAIASRRPKLVVQHSGGTCGAAPVQASCGIDVKGSGSTATSPDGVLILRYLLGFRGAALTDGLSIVPPRNTSAAIESFLADNDYSAVRLAGNANIDGLIMLRLLQGVPDSALLNGIIVPVGAAFRDAAAIRANVNARCGTAF